MKNIDRSDAPPTTLDGKRNPAYTKWYEALPHRKARTRERKSTTEHRERETVRRANRESSDVYASRILSDLEHRHDGQVEFLEDTVYGQN